MSCVWLMVCISAAAAAQSLTWTQLHLPPAAAVSHIIGLPGGSLMVGTSGKGVFFSDDLGLTWTGIQSGLGSLDIQGLSCSDSGLVVAATAAGIFLWEGGVGSWHRCDAPANNYRRVATIGSGHLIVAVPQGVLVSPDSGRTWTPSATIGLPQFNAFAPTDENTICAATSNGVFKSTDRGNTWISSGLSGMDVSGIAEAPSGRLHAIADSRGVGTFFSDDSGKTWNQKNGGIEDELPSALAISPDGTIWVGTYDGTLAYLLPGGDTFSQRTPDGQFSHILSLWTSHDNVVYIGTVFGGLFATGTGTEEIVTRNDGLPTGWGIILGSDSEYLFAANPYAGLYRSRIPGSKWFPANTSLGGSHLYTFHAGTTGLLLGTTIEIAWVGNLWRSTDHGLSWFADQEGIPLVDPGRWPWINPVLSIDENSEGQLMALVDGSGLFTKPAGATSWQPFAGVLPNGRPLSMCVGPDDAVFVGGDDGGVYVTTDDGLTWDTSLAGRAEYFLHFLSSSSSGVLALRSKNGTASGTQAFMFGGATSGWTDLRTEAFGLHLYTAVSDADGNILVGTDSAGVLRSTNGGTSWQSIRDGLLSNTVTSLHATTSGHVFAGTPDAGLFRTSFPTTHFREDRPPETIPEAVTCFPNPFNSSTTIHISVGAPGRVQVIVYDILGRLVEVLLDDYLRSGHVSRNWQPKGNPSGTYVVRLRNKDHVSTTKVLYLR